MASCQECWPGYSKVDSKSKPLEIVVVNRNSVINGPLERKLHKGKDLLLSSLLYLNPRTVSAT